MRRISMLRKSFIGLIDLDLEGLNECLESLGAARKLITMKSSGIQVLF